VECLASGLPIITTNAGGIPYIVSDEKTALMVDLDDDRGVAERVFRLLEDPALVERLTEEGRCEVQKVQERAG
jgi:glycosyltransferase involved in cell wall biosynthesis